MPQLFAQMPGGLILAPLFFLGLSFAAFSSLISMVELAGRILMDLGFNRKKAVISVGVVGFLAGIPSAISLGFLVNQDWVWGVALMISGAFIAFAIVKYGEENFRSNIVNIENSEWNVGRWWSFVIKYLIPLQVTVLLTWWLYNSTKWYPDTWWHPFNLKTPETLGTCIVQWGIVIIVLFLLNKKLSKLKYN
jgi:NSS family neurotransmitter:Na+ symporter